MDDLFPLLIFVFLAAGFTALGVYTLRNPGTVAGFFNGFGAGIFGTKTANKVYTETSMRAAGIAFVIMGPVFVILGVTLLIRILSAYLG